ncbi:MAG TPA: sulfotransferase [Acidimicrobiales bacterium]|nr:sulfotransferase [Acidimicrobiales bacterium]
MAKDTSGKRFSRVPVVYVGGTGRSGSTVLARLLARTPGVVAVGELRYVLERGVTENHLCGCGEPFRACPFWMKVLHIAGTDESTESVRSLQALAAGVDRNRYVVPLLFPRLRTHAFQRRLDAYGDHLVRLYEAIAAVSGARLIVDSSKDPSYAFVLHAAGLDLRLLHLVRDSRAVAFSWTRRKLRPEVQGTETHMRTRAPARSAALWTGYHLLFEWLRRHVEHYRRVRYEDFAADAERELAATLAWMGLDSGTRADVVVHDISGNPVRFAEGPLTVRADTAWETEMAPRDHRTVTRLTRPLLRRYGYLGRRP